MRPLLFAVLLMAASLASFASPVTYKTVEVDGLNVFYREAGPPDAPVLLLEEKADAVAALIRTFLSQGGR